MTDLSDTTTGELLALARRDGQNLGPLLEAYRSYLTMLARIQIDDRMKSKTDASDLVQECFMAAHRHFASFRGTTEAEFLAWLRRILASNVSAIMRQFKGAQRRDVHLEQRLTHEIDRSSQIAGGLAGSQTSPSDRAVLRERAVLLADALESLPSHYRQVILLRDLKGLSYPEVGRRMDRSAEAVRKIWIRALAELHELLAEKLDEEL